MEVTDVGSIWEATSAAVGPRTFLTHHSEAVMLVIRLCAVFRSSLVPCCVPRLARRPRAAAGRGSADQQPHLRHTPGVQ